MDIGQRRGAIVGAAGDDNRAPLRRAIAMFGIADYAVVRRRRDRLPDDPGSRQPRPHHVDRQGRRPRRPRRDARRDRRRPGADVARGRRRRRRCWPRTRRRFARVQWLGAGYLAWLGLRMLLAKPGDAPVLHIRAGQYFRQAFTITLLNPKAIVFYMAFFPLFVDPARHAGIAHLRGDGGDDRRADLPLRPGRHGADAPARRAAARRPAHRPAASTRAAGVFMIGFGLKLALSR